MNKERLLKLAEVLETESRGRTMIVPGDGTVTFDMNYVYLKNSSAHKCGTAACALGYAALHPWFRKRGLKISEHGVVNYRWFGGGSFGAGKGFFDLSTDQTDQLFAPIDCSETPKQVAKRIRRFVKEHE